MFKKTLVAASLAALSTGAFAVNVASTTLEHTKEGVQTSVTISAAEATATLKAEYKVDDLITFTFSQDLASTFSATTTINADFTSVVTGGGTNELTLGKLSQTTNSVTYRVTNLNLSATDVAEQTTVGATVAIEAVDFDGAALRAAGSASVTWAATLSNGTTPLDQATGTDKAAAKIVELKDQFKVTVSTAANGVIDVEDNRESFTSAVYADVVGLTIAEDGVAGDSATLVKTTYTINGNFAFLDTDADTAGIQLGTNTVTPSTGTLTVAADKIVVSNTSATPAVSDVTITLDPIYEAILPTQTFTVDADVDYTDVLGVAADTSTNIAAGAWTINGSQITFPYAPIGYDNIVTQFEVANSGNQNSEIVVDAFDTAGNKYSAVLPQLAEAGKLTKVGFADLTTAFGLTSGTKLSVTFTVSAPVSEIKITGYSNLNNAGRMALLSSAYEGK